MNKNYFKDCKRGDTFNGRTITLQNDDLTPVDLTGATAIMQFRAITNGNVIFEFKTADGSITIPTPTSGALMMMPRLMNVPANNYLFDLQIKFQNQSVKTILSNFWNITNDISR